MGPSETTPGAGLRGRRRPGPLSRREREVLELLAEGLSGAEIAERLVLSPETVRTHIRNAMAKLSAATRSQAVAIALHRREIDPQPNVGEPPSPGPRGSSAAAPQRSDVEQALSSVLDGLVSLWDVDAGSLFLTDEDGLTLRRVAHVVGGSRRGPPESLALGEGALGRVALERRAQIVADPGVPGGAGMIIAPMLAGGRLTGVLSLTTRASRPIGRHELLLLQAFATRIAEVVQASGPQAVAGLRGALERFRVSWASSTRAG